MSDFNSPQMLQALDEYERENYYAALKILTPLAESGNLRAQCYLASLYECGLGIEVDLEKAVDLYLQVAKKRIQEGNLSGVAYNNLATIYAVGGKGINRDKEKANKYFELAKNLGFKM